MPALSAAGRVARAGRPREGAPVPRRGRTGAGRCRGSATRTRGSCCSGWRRRPTAATGPGGSSPATPRATSCGRRCTGPGSRIEPASRRADDGLTLTDAYIAAAVRCAPPANKPTIDERDTCAPFLARELGAADGGAGHRRARRLRLGGGAPGAAATGHDDAAEAAVRPRRRGDDRAVPAARHLPPEPAEHVHRPADGRRCSMRSSGGQSTLARSGPDRAAPCSARR